MNRIIDLNECQQDSPKFRKWLNNTEKNFFNWENKVDKAIKQSYQVVSSGRAYVSEQEQLITAFSELSTCYSKDPLVSSSITKLLECLKETVLYQQSLIDQTNQVVADYLLSYMKSENKQIKEIRQNFEKSGSELDYIIHKVATCSKLQDSEDANNQLLRIRKGFRHCSIDYAKALAFGQERNRYEVLFSVLSHTKAYATFYHQGSDLCNDYTPIFNRISKDICEIKKGLVDMEKDTKNIHLDVSGEHLNASMGDTDNCISKNGYLFKRSTNAFKTWNYRYFLLEYNKLLYQKRSGEDVTIMEEDLRLCNVKVAGDTDRKFCFEIISNAKTHLLQAESESSRKEWVETLNKAITTALTDETLSNYDYDQLSQKGSADGVIRLKPSPLCSPKTNVLRRITRITGNDFCCDCLQANPKWASINLGITLCIECSGIHRSLGVHRSKVRSLTLDHWDEEVIMVMEALGNAIVNEIYLAEWPNKSIAVERPMPNCERSIREKWIKLKYVERKFVMSLSNKESLTKILKSIQDFRSLDTSIDNISLDSISKNSVDEDEIFAKKRIAEDSELWNSSVVCTLKENQLLLSASASANLPLMVVALAVGANKTYRCDQGKLPLHYAVLSNSSEALELLLQNGCAVNVADKDYQTPLHLAASNNNIFHAYRLLIAKADHKLKDKAGCMPLDYAVKANEPHLVTLLRVATLFDQLERESVEEELKAIMIEITGKRSA